MHHDPDHGDRLDGLSLAALGWRGALVRQVEMSEDALVPVRVVAVHRGHLDVVGVGIDARVPLAGARFDDDDLPTVGDWLLVEPDSHRIRRLLDRYSLFKRRAPGTGRAIQQIAANVDTAFIVTSCNQDFNIARLERFLVLAREADVFPVVVLTKADLADDPHDFARQVQRLPNAPLVEVVDAREPSAAEALAPFCAEGQTVAFLGSSGVGKSTLINTLTGRAAIRTQGIRQDDDKGRHTTSGRAMHRLPQGGWLIDTPGMREIQITDAAAGLAEVFEDVEAHAAACRFADCAHESEPGCAVLRAVEAGDLDPARLARWRKLVAEERANTETLAERRARGKELAKKVRSASQYRRDRGGR